ncbi:unnamed protein product [Caenorhabditis angaria]|uniref:Uncharacterized protein n=1 Tax=Caenorhabditis angaria TaxID=860376 RepID=A0A9P1N9B7_9PELO|nr:unnamed protein product [Caenorhabditis angaria]
MPLLSVTSPTSMNNSSNSIDLCPESYRTSVNLLSIIITIPTIFEFLILFLLLLRISFLLLIFSYTLCNSFVLIKSIVDSFDETSQIIKFIDDIYTWVYMYIQPCVVIGLLERLCSTYFVKSYEHSRLWPIFILAQIIAGIIVWWEVSLEYTNLIKYSQLGLSTFICLCLIVLFFVNRKLTLDSRHKSKLTVRYQLTENVKALRIFVPFVVIDNCLSVMFVISLHFFNVDFNFDSEICRTTAGYTFWFMFFRVILLVVQIAMPIIVIKSHHSIWTKIEKKIRKTRQNEISSDSQKHKKNVLKLKNSLGMDITGTHEDHFEQLRNHFEWLQKLFKKFLNENCSTSDLQLIARITFFILIPQVFLLTLSIYHFFPRRHNYHPIFSTFFLALISLYLVSSIALCFRNLLTGIWNWSENAKIDFVVTYIEKIYIIFNYFIQPCIAIGVIERIIATILYTKYEKLRLWWIFVILFLVSCGLVYLEFTLRHRILSSISTRHIQAILSIFITILLISLLVINRQKTRISTTVKSNLSERYQLTENVKVLRIYIPIIAIDSIIQIFFLITDLFFDIGFLIFYSIPILILRHFRGPFDFCCLRRKMRKSPKENSVTPYTDRVQVKNVFGENLTAHEHGKIGQDVHFQNLFMQWK